MTDSNYTHILVISDRSGSMGEAGDGSRRWPAPPGVPTVADNMVQGLNGFFKEQAELPGKCLVDFVQFDTTFEKVYTDRSIAEATASCTPRGGTALLEAIGRSVTELGTKLRALPEVHRPGNVIVVVLTDGEENSSSRAWTAEKVKALVETQTGQWGWTFTFLGANIDAVKTGQSYGFSYDNSLTYNTSNVIGMANSLNTFAGATRSGIVAGYSQEDRDAQFEVDSSV